MYREFELLIDGKEAFPEIINCINNSKTSIIINMFIWRYDNIGIEVARAVLNAANRGVKVTISIDRYGVILENAEESRQSFFHKKTNFFEKIQYFCLRVFNPKLSKKEKKDYGDKDLYNKIINHPNIIVDNNRVKKDHSKYYIFDDSIVIFGGINIEDKENGKDVRGIVYQDYMVKIIGKENVDCFKRKLKSNFNSNENYYFGMNYKEVKPYIFEMKQLYIDMINNSKEKLIIVMPYFHAVKEVVEAIISAYNRGVDVKIMIPKYPNFQNGTNIRCMYKLMKKTKNGIKVYLSPKMVHTKLMITEKLITLGSTNINNKSFNVLSELNIFVNNFPCDFINDIINSVNENIKVSKKVNNYKELKYNKVCAFFEGMIV